VGWISRKNLGSGRGGAFFLTFLFIELIDPKNDEEKAHTCVIAVNATLIKEALTESKSIRCLELSVSPVHSNFGGW
jgi:hypothetical protein